jgi:acyl-coenzyme A synthetase/AMP-(fatty) acid ligase
MDGEARADPHLDSIACHNLPDRSLWVEQSMCAIGQHCLWQSVDFAGRVAHGNQTVPQTSCTIAGLSGAQGRLDGLPLFPLLFAYPQVFAMSAFQPNPPEIADRVPDDAAGAREIGFDLPRAYNASRLLFDNLDAGHGDAPAIVAAEGTFSYSDLCSGASQFSHGLKSLSLERGDRVLLVLADSPYAVAAFFGAIRAGLVPVLLDPASSSEAIRFAAIDSEALTAIVDASVLTRITGASLTGTRLSALIVVDGEPSGREPIPAIPVFAWLGELPSDSTAAATDRDEMAFWLYTPSDAGRPKAVVHLQHDLAYAAACHARAMLGLGASDRCLSYSPMHTATGLCASLAFPFSAGASSICRAVLGATAAGPVLEPLAAVLAFRPTVLFGVPEFYADVLARSSAGVSAL